MFNIAYMTTQQGWVKIHRQLLEWEWYDDHNTKILFLHLLLKANHKDHKYRGKMVKRGQLLTGRDLLSKETGLSVQKIRTSLSNLESTNEITIKTNSKGTVIQIVNYNKYQVATNETTNNQPTSNQQVTTNKNDKEGKEKYREFKHLSLSLEEYDKLRLDYSSVQIDDILDSIENYKKNSNYTSLYLTALKWLKKEVKNDSPYPLKKGSREYNVELQVGLIDVNGYPTKKV